MPQPCPRKLRPALAAVLMKLAEICVIEQHFDKLLLGVQPTNLGLGTPDAAALMVRIVRGWAKDMAMTPRRGRMPTLCCQLIWKTPTAGLFVLRAWKRPGLYAHSLQRFARRNGLPVT